jgi:hypothetical protein
MIWLMLSEADQRPAKLLPRRFGHADLAGGAESRQRRGRHTRRNGRLQKSTA